MGARCTRIWLRIGPFLSLFIDAQHVRDFLANLNQFYSGGSENCSNIAKDGGFLASRRWLSTAHLHSVSWHRKGISENRFGLFYCCYFSPLSSFRSAHHVFVYRNTGQGKKDRIHCPPGPYCARACAVVWWKFSPRLEWCLANSKKENAPTHSGWIELKDCLTQDRWHIGSLWLLDGWKFSIRSATEQ